MNPTLKKIADKFDLPQALMLCIHDLNDCAKDLESAGLAEKAKQVRETRDVAQAALDRERAKGR